jgi:hypothetical protein
MDMRLRGFAAAICLQVALHALLLVQTCSLEAHS